MAARPLIDPLRGLLLALMAAPALMAPAYAQVAPGPPRRDITRPMEFSTGQDDNLFSLRRSQEDIHEWNLALSELRDGAVQAAVERMHKLLQNEFGGVAPVAPGRFQGLRLAVVQTMANMSPAAQQAYEKLVRRQAGYLVERPLHELAPEQLEMLAYRYPTASVGRRARKRLGDLALETGSGAEAMGHFRRALDASTIGSNEEKNLFDRMLVARTLIEPRTARAAFAESRLEQAASEALAVLPPSLDPSGYLAVGGGHDGRTPMSVPAGRPVMAGGGQRIYAQGFDTRESGLYAMTPVGDLDGLYINTGRRVVAYDPLRNDVAWVSVAPLGDQSLPQRMPQSIRRRGGPMAGQINHDMVLAAACSGDLVIAALQVPERSANVHFHNNFRILTKIPKRRVFAYSRTTGKLVWSHYDELDGPRTRRFRGHDACGPPLVFGDTLYVPIHDRSGAIAFSIGAYDVETGKKKWRRLVCSSQQEVNMFGNARMEFAASPLCISDGVIYGASNLGIVFAIDAANGAARWIKAHDVVRMPTTSFRRQQSRAIYFMNNVPVAVDSVVCITPLDSPYVLGLDAQSGKELWRIPADAPVNGVRNDIRWLAGVLDDEFILTGRGAIAVKARPIGAALGHAEVRQLVRPEVFRQNAGNAVSGRPAVTADHVWVGRLGAITAWDRAGNSIAIDRQIRSQRLQSGNLVFVNGIVASLRLGSLDVLMDKSAVLAQVEERQRRDPDDPAAILRLATLRAALLPASPSTEDRQAVTALYRKGLEACQRRGLAKSHPVRKALQRELYDQALDAATVAIARSDSRALELLTVARETAPDTKTWLRVQLLVLEQCTTYPKRLRIELDRLEHDAIGAMIPLPGGAQPVRAYVLYRKTQLPDVEPLRQVEIWQELLESYSTTSFDGETVRQGAPAAIARLIRRYGPDCYRTTAVRAQVALTEAGDDPEALRTIGTRFPNSKAAKTARTRVLDRSVARGDLGIACEVLAQELGRADTDPRVLRRVLVAALGRGNRGLAQAMARRLQPHASMISDWPADQGRNYGAVLTMLAPKMAFEPRRNRLALPTNEVARIRPRTPRESFRLVPVIHARGFAAPTDVPLFAVAGADLLAIDLHQKGNQKPILFALPVQFLEHVVLCGDTLVVPDLERVFAIDYRTGDVRWELPETNGHLLDGLGVQSGIFHLSAQPSDGEGPARFIGLEPLSGRIVFSRALPGERMRPVPKPIAGQLLVMQTDENNTTSLMRLDPLSGQTLATIKLAEALPRTEGLATRIYPQGLCGDSEHIYLPIDSTLSGDAPRLFAIAADGTVAWKWQGKPNRHLLMAALRDDRLVIVEGSDQQPGSVTIMRAADGDVIRTLSLGHDIDVLNWQRGWLPNPAPKALMLSDLATPSGRERRFYCIGIDAEMLSFVETLNREHGEIERQPQLGEGFLTFGVRPTRRGQFRLYSLNLGNRRGALPGGQKYQALTIDPTYALTAVGPYTVLCCAEYLVVLGPEESNR